jgi:hypothetical protein
MKKQMIQKLTVFLIMAMLSVSPVLIAQDPPPPPGNHGETGNQSPPGGGVPIGSGIALLLALGTAYGARKIYQMKKQD